MTSGEETKSKSVFLRILVFISSLGFVVTGIFSIIFGVIPWPGLIVGIVQFGVAFIGFLGALRMAKFVLAVLIGTVVGTIVLLVVSIISLAAVNSASLGPAAIVFSISILLCIGLFILGLMLYKRAIRKCF